MPNLSIVTVAEIVKDPGQFVLVRNDPQTSGEFIWCGRALGWMPFGATARVHRYCFPSVEAAVQAADECVKHPLPSRGSGMGCG